VLWVNQAGFLAERQRAERLLEGSAVLEVVAAHELSSELSRKPAGELAAILIAVSDPSVAQTLAREIRARDELLRTRLFIATPLDLEEQCESLDIERCLVLADCALDTGVELLKMGLAAYRALGKNSLLPRNYLDASYNEIYDWFENTRWDWTDIDLKEIRRDLLTSAEVAILKESAVIEFGTLPGAHNFLREWSDEYSFSSWALSWGAEEARHSLVQSRYLRSIGIEVQAKHAMYKREPYPIGHNRAATLMMNIVSEARAAEYYLGLAGTVKEPVLQNIWSLLGRDEARHCRAFAFFCKELCDHDPTNIAPALEMAYVFCADRSNGVKHPAGYFYPHSTSTRGLRGTEAYLQETTTSSTDRADRRVFEVVRQITRDSSVRSVKDIRRKLRELAQ
jgi:hypothetical protein